MPVGVKSTIYGAKETRAALRKFAPDVLKAMDKEINSAVTTLTTAAKAELPESPPMKGWRTSYETSRKKAVYGMGDFTFKRDKFLGYTSTRGWVPWESGEIHRGIKRRQGRRRKTGYRYSGLIALVNSSAAGSIFEVAGRRNTPVPGTRGWYFIDKLNRSFGHASRVIWRAIDEKGTSEVQDAVAKAYRLATAQLEARLELAASGASAQAQRDAFETLMRGK